MYPFGDARPVDRRTDTEPDTLGERRPPSIEGDAATAGGA